MRRSLLWCSYSDYDTLLMSAFKKKRSPKKCCNDPPTYSTSMRIKRQQQNWQDRAWYGDFYFGQTDRGFSFHISANSKPNSNHSRIHIMYTSKFKLMCTQAHINHKNQCFQGVNASNSENAICEGCLSCCFIFTTNNQIGILCSLYCSIVGERSLAVCVNISVPSVQYL